MKNPVYIGYRAVSSLIEPIFLLHLYNVTFASAIAQASLALRSALGTFVKY